MTRYKQHKILPFQVDFDSLGPNEPFYSMTIDPVKPLNTFRWIINGQIFQIRPFSQILEYEITAEDIKIHGKINFQGLLELDLKLTSQNREYVIKKGFGKIVLFEHPIEDWENTEFWDEKEIGLNV